MTLSSMGIYDILEYSIYGIYRRRLFGCIWTVPIKESRFCTRREIPNPNLLSLSQNEKQRPRAHLGPHRIS
jgi:hypothetical protein